MTLSSQAGSSGPAAGLVAWMAYGPRMGGALAITFGGGGGADAGPSGTAIVVLLLVALVALPVLIGLVLRRRDRRRPSADADDGRRVPEPPESPVFAGSWGRTSGVLRRSARGDWLMVVAVAAAVLVLLVATQV